MSDFEVKNALQKWSQTSPKSMMALHNMKKLTENIIMRFRYVSRSIDTFLVVYEPYRALEGLEGSRLKLLYKNGLKLLQNQL